MMLIRMPPIRRQILVPDINIFASVVKNTDAAPKWDGVGVCIVKLEEKNLGAEVQEPRQGIK